MPTDDSEVLFYYRLGQIAAARQELDRAVDTYRAGAVLLGLHGLQEALMHIGKAMGFDSVSEMLAKLYS